MILKVFFLRAVLFSLGVRVLFTFVLITLIVAEARVALRILTMLVRTHGEDLLYLQDIQLWDCWTIESKGIYQVTLKVVMGEPGLNANQYFVLRFNCLYYTACQWGQYGTSEVELDKLVFYGIQNVGSLLNISQLQSPPKLVQRVCLKC